MAGSIDRLGVQKPGFCRRYRLRGKGYLKNPVSFVLLYRSKSASDRSLGNSGYLQSQASHFLTYSTHGDRPWLWQIEKGDPLSQHFQYTSSWLPMSSKRISSSPDSGFSTKSNTIRQSYSTVQAQEPANWPLSLCVCSDGSKEFSAKSLKTSSTLGCSSGCLRMRAL